MSDTMRRRSCAVSAVCVAACMLSNVPDADACNVGGSTTLVWPTHDGLDESARRPAPTDTQIWLHANASWGAPADVIIEGPSGASVETVREVLTHTDLTGVASDIITLKPLAELDPETAYRVVLVPQDEDQYIEYAERQGTEYVREGWTFTTGSGPHSGGFPADLERSYVTFEREERFQEFCAERERDAVHILRLSEFLSDVPFIHSFEIVYHNDSQQLTRRVWSGEGGEQGELRVVLGESLLEDAYPCVTHTMTDVTGRTRHDSVGCAPSFCVEPPPYSNGYGEGSIRSAYMSFLSGPIDAWLDCEKTCAQQAGGCATTPASPIPRTPLALGALALLGLLRTNRSRKRHV